VHRVETATLGVQTIMEITGTSRIHMQLGLRANPVEPWVMGSKKNGSNHGSCIKSMNIQVITQKHMLPSSSFSFQAKEHACTFFFSGKTLVFRHGGRWWRRRAGVPKVLRIQKFSRIYNHFSLLYSNPPLIFENKHQKVLDLHQEIHLLTSIF
jgi:hypothetical protein